MYLVIKSISGISTQIKCYITNDIENAIKQYKSLIVEFESNHVDEETDWSFDTRTLEYGCTIETLRRYANGCTIEISTEKTPQDLEYLVETFNTMHLDYSISDLR